MKFKDKLEKFKTERVGFHVDTKEIADELQKVFDREKLNNHEGIMEIAWRRYGKTKDLYVSYNVTQKYIGFGTCECSGDDLKEILPITLEELKEYSSNQQLTITITSDGYHRVTAESNGKTAEALCNPTDTFDVAEGAKLAIQRLTAEVIKETKEEPKGKHKFNKGDTVEILPVAVGTASDFIGRIGTIVENSYIAFVQIDGTTGTIPCYESELKKANEVPKFSIGDTVEVINGGPNNTPVESKGMRGKVVEKFKGRISVEFGKILSSSSKTASNFWYRSKDLKLVPKDEFMFHKGDLVEVIKEGMLTNGSIGLQGIVMEDDNDPFVTLVTEVNGRKRWCFNQENLKLIRRANA